MANISVRVGLVFRAPGWIAFPAAGGAKTMPPRGMLEREPSVGSLPPTTQGTVPLLHLNLFPPQLSSLSEVSHRLPCQESCHLFLTPTSLGPRKHALLHSEREQNGTAGAISTHDALALLLALGPPPATGAPDGIALARPPTTLVWADGCGGASPMVTRWGRVTSRARFRDAATGLRTGHPHRLGRWRLVEPLLGERRPASLTLLRWQTVSEDRSVHPPSRSEKSPRAHSCVADIRPGA